MDGATIDDTRTTDPAPVEEDFALRSDEAERAGDDTPRLHLDGFDGPLDTLLMLARAQKIALAEIPLVTLVDQLTAALLRAPPTLPLSRKGDWVVMTAWLLQLRSVLFLPVDAPAQQAATAAADDLRTRLAGLQEMQALAGWLDRRPQLGRDVFVRGAPERVGVSVDASQAIDVVEFLWASMALFDVAEAPDTTTVYKPPFPDLFRVPAAIERVRARLAEQHGPEPLEAFLPTLPPDAADRAFLAKSAVSSTFMAALELTRDGDLTIEQDAAFREITVTPIAPSVPPAREPAADMYLDTSEN